MHQTERRQYDMLTRVRDFGTTYGHLLHASSAQQALAAVTTSIEALEEHDLRETTASIAARATRKRAARKALVERLVLVEKAAELLPGRDAGFLAHFDVPHGANDRVLLTAARQFVERATPLATLFVEHGMPASFPADLEALIERFEAALRDRGMSRDERVAARARTRASLAEAIAAVRRLDVIVATHLAPDSEARQVWARSRRVSYPGASRNAAAEPPREPAAASAPAPTPVVAPAEVVAAFRS